MMPFGVPLLMVINLECFAWEFICNVRTTSDDEWYVFELLYGISRNILWSKSVDINVSLPDMIEEIRL